MNLLSAGSSSATAYLTPEVLKRPNLTVAISVTTEKVLFEGTPEGTPKAVGVQLSTSRNGPRFAVGASREVIMCAGAVGSPQILQLSGVGPSAHLTQLGIPTVHDLPAVGDNLRDVRSLTHYGAGCRLLTKDTLLAARLRRRDCFPGAQRLDLGSPYAEPFPCGRCDPALATLGHRAHGFAVFPARHVHSFGRRRVSHTLGGRGTVRMHRAEHDSAACPLALHFLRRT